MGGAMGFEKLVALKRILPHLVHEREFVEMFLDEAKLVARINHPNVVQIFDFGKAETTFYIAMEYLAGADLATVAVSYLRQGLKMPIADVCLCISQGAAGLHAAHELRDPDGKLLGLVHRDVSPQNLFVTFDGICKVLDFGVAKAAGRLSTTRTGNIKGKLSYMAPEQAKSEPLDRRADIYALGIVLWELLATKRLFKADTEVATLTKVLAAVVPQIRDINPDVPEDVARVVHKSLMANPDDRFQTCEDFANALEEAMLANKLSGRQAPWGKALRELMPGRHQRTLSLVETASKGETSHVLDADLPAEEHSLPNKTPTRAGRLSRKAPPGAETMDAIPGFPVEDKTDPGRSARRVHPAILAGGAIVLLGVTGGLLVARQAQKTETEQEEAAQHAAAQKLAAEKALVEKTQALNQRTREMELATKAVEEKARALVESLAKAARNAELEREEREKARERERKRASTVTRPAAAEGTKGPIGFGFLTLDTSPWTQVFVGDRDLGLTPLNQVKLPAGKNTLTLRNPEKGIATSVVVEIALDQVTVRKISL
jgi:serine/threonine-protein kinase